MKNKDLKLVKGYVYLNDGSGKYVSLDLINESENIASFVFNCPSDTKVLITNVFDEPLCDTFGNFLNKCYDLDYREFFINQLVELQTFQKEPCKVKIEFDEENEGCTLDEFKEFIYNKTGYEL